ncbi:receptor-like serine/threonine-protein kinase SD1-8 [Neltuma alba]|uniref:receptor-like serine/threonine-protein kinase SD1-8 n=1 Tax=Neltuma alba TaxID=207710 RepID=UPI0010A30EA2|nr:receptor-like serine/threonine-protein kinase SD1-8 [Prosopis alba]
MLSRIAVTSVLIINVLLFSQAQSSWVQSAYWFSGSGFPVSDINSHLFTHLICAFANVNSSSFELYVASDDEQSFSTFTTTVRRKNPSVITLLSIGGGLADYSALSSMVSNVSSRKSFIQSSIRIARSYAFQGLDLSWVSANTSSDMNNMGMLFKEWREAANSEAQNTSNPELILTAAVQFRPGSDFGSYPVESIRSNLNWVHVMAYDYYMPTWANFTGAHAALYDPSSDVNTDSGIKEWIGRGVSANQLVLSLPFYGYAWTLENPKDNAIGAPATGPAITDDGDMSYKDIKAYIRRYGATVLYNSTYVVKYFSVGSNWVGFDDAKVLKIKVSYAREKKLLGYVVWAVSYDDDNWELSTAAAQNFEDTGHSRGRLLAIILTPIAVFILLLGAMMFCLRKRIFRSIEMVEAARGSKFKANKGDAEHFHGNGPDLQVFSFSDIEEATDGFSIENKLGEGGYGPVYKGVLADGQEIAVKKLAEASKQGFEEFKNEVTLTARLQHVNLVRLLGFYIDRGEQMLVYEYMPNKSLDFYLFDPIRRYLLDWGKRVDIIEGIVQGLVYLQEYSRLTIIHRDIKASNILLSDELKPKISDFGMARIFAKDADEANTSKIVGTYGYVPPEYVKKGLYSTKSDVYSFGVLLLQIISGKRTTSLYGEQENLNLTGYAYELWKEGKGMDFVGPTLDDSSSTCKLLRCMQIALLCVQESANDRPSMLEISSMLKRESNLTFPKKPAFSRENNVEEANEGIVQMETKSINEMTVSELVAR